MGFNNLIILDEQGANLGKLYKFATGQVSHVGKKAIRFYVNSTGQIDLPIYNRGRFKHDIAANKTADILYLSRKLFDHLIYQNGYLCADEKHIETIIKGATLGEESRFTLSFMIESASLVGFMSRLERSFCDNACKYAHTYNSLIDAKNACIDFALFLEGRYIEITDDDRFVIGDSIFYSSEALNYLRNVLGYEGDKIDVKVPLKTYLREDSIYYTVEVKDGRF